MYEEWLHQLDLEIQFRVGVKLVDIQAWINPAWYGWISVEEVADKLLKEV